MIRMLLAATLIVGGTTIAIAQGAGGGTGTVTRDDNRPAVSQPEELFATGMSAGTRRSGTIIQRIPASSFGNPDGRQVQGLRSVNVPAEVTGAMTPGSSGNSVPFQAYSDPTSPGSRRGFFLCPE